MDDLPSYPPNPQGTPSRFNTVELPDKPALLDFYALGALPPYHDAIYSRSNQHIEALARKLSLQGLKLQDTWSAPQPRAQTLHAPSCEDYGGPWTSGNKETMTLQTQILDAPDDEHLMEGPMSPVIEPEEQHLISVATLDHEEISSSALQIDEGYFDDISNYTCADWPDFAEMDSYVGCRVGGLLQFKTSSEAALQSSRLVRKAPRMRKRKYRTSERISPASKVTSDGPSRRDLKRVRHA